MNAPNSIIYEQPVNEYARISLRLEQLFRIIDYRLLGESSWDNRALLEAMLEIVTIIDRPDLKMLFTKELARHHAVFSRLSQLPNINHDALAKTLGEIETVLDALNKTSGKIGQILKENDFLATIQMYRANPAGVCVFDAPAYHFWLNQPLKIRQAQMLKWLNHLSSLQTAVTLFLRLLRESNLPQICVAAAGLYQTALDPKTPCQLIRVMIPGEVDVYPEISVGRHRIFIRLFRTNFVDKPRQVADDIEFHLVSCMI